MCMWPITSNILNLIEKFLYIINNRYSEIISQFLYDFCVSCWPADITWCWAKAFDVHRSKVN